jgi:two-component system response regulator RegX3
MALVLVIEDEAETAGELAAALAREGLVVRIAETGRLGLAAASEVAPDVVVLDVGLADIRGIDVCARLRASSDVPILAISAGGGGADAVDVLEAGADDCVSHPYRLREIVARTRAQLRRPRRGDRPAEPVVVLEANDVRFDPASLRVTVCGRDVRLRPKELAFLEALLENAGHVLTRRALVDRVWGPGHIGADGALEVLVHRVRSKVEDDLRHPRRILTVRGIGYRFERGTGERPTVAATPAAARGLRSAHLPLRGQ